MKPLLAVIPGKKVRLRDKLPSDVENDYAWHADRELARLDATFPTPLTYEEYRADYASNLRLAKTRRRYTFAVETLTGEHIGNCAYYDVDEESGEAEIGLMIGNRSYWDQGYGQDALTTLVDYVFTHTDLKRLYLRTLESNKRAQACFEKSGFSPYVTLVRNSLSFVFMELTRKTWEKKQKPLENSG
jgi:RimJ/RimL family protein N-acetyltransferase